MPQVEVKCSVSNCTYWGKGNFCEAPSIMVEIDRHADYSTEMAGEMGSEHQDYAGSSRETCCKTFKPKSK